MPGAAGPASKAKASVAVMRFLETGNLVMVVLPNQDDDVILYHYERQMTDIARLYVKASCPIPWRACRPTD
jgi:hypothetical protein